MTIWLNAALCAKWFWTTDPRHVQVQIWFSDILCFDLTTNSIPTQLSRWGLKLLGSIRMCPVFPSCWSAGMLMMTRGKKVVVGWRDMIAPHLVPHLTVIHHQRNPAAIGWAVPLSFHHGFEDCWDKHLSCFAEGSQPQVLRATQACRGLKMKVMMLVLELATWS